MTEIEVYNVELTRFQKFMHGFDNYMGKVVKLFRK